MPNRTPRLHRCNFGSCAFAPQGYQKSISYARLSNGCDLFDIGTTRLIKRAVGAVSRLPNENHSFGNNSADCICVCYSLIPFGEKVLLGVAAVSLWRRVKDKRDVWPNRTTDLTPPSPLLPPLVPTPFASSVAPNCQLSNSASPPVLVAP